MVKVRSLQEPLEKYLSLNKMIKSVLLAQIMNSNERLTNRCKEKTVVSTFDKAFAIAAKPTVANGVEAMLLNIKRNRAKRRGGVATEARLLHNSALQ